MPSVLESLNAGLHQAMSGDKRVYLLGEDVLDPYGGAFKVTRGLSTAFPERVLTTPISEAGITGVAAGMALRGLRPVVEIMFGDFITLISDQIVNHAAKFRYMYNEQVQVPLVIRTPMGGRRGYGPTHSQSLEKFFLGVPGLQVLAPSALGDPGELLAQAILKTEDPLLFVENKLLYLLPVQAISELEGFEVTLQPPRDESAEQSSRPIWAPAYRLRLRSAPPATLTLAAYGYMAELARSAMLELAEQHEIFCELVTPTRLSPCEIEPIAASVRRTGRLMAVEEGTLSLGWGAEVIARAAETLGSGLKRAHRLAAREIPIPASGPLEAGALPDSADIVEAARQMNSG